MNRRARAVALLGLLVLSVPTLPVLGLALAPGASTGPCATPTITGTASDDAVQGTPGPDVIDGLGGNDEIAGLGGDDVICGGAGTDRLDGGEGSDRLHGGTDGKVSVDTGSFEFDGDTLTGGPGDDLLEMGDDLRTEGSDDALSFRGSATGVVLDLPAGTAVGEGTDTVVGEVQRVLGSDHDDVLVGTDEDQELFGYRGTDHIDGGGGDDYVDGASTYEGATGELSETSGNVLLGGSGSDMVLGSDGDDVVIGGTGRDSLGGGSGLDQVGGGAGRDTVLDTVLPGEGQVVSGGSGRDDLLLYFGHSAQRLLRDVVVRVDLGAGTARARARTATVRLSTPGFESIEATHGERWFIRGTDGPDSIFAFDRVPVVTRGLGGNDTLDGSSLDDVLDGGPGYDRAGGLSGGQDRYIAVEKILR